MKVTTLLPDALVDDVRHLAKGKTLTDSLVSALTSWTKQQKLLLLTQELKTKPLSFQTGITTAKLRDINRSR